MPINHYVDKDYRYILFRFYRLLPAVQQSFLTKFPWKSVKRALKMHYEAVIQTIQNLKS